MNDNEKIVLNIHKRLSELEVELVALYEQKLKITKSIVSIKESIILLQQQLKKLEECEGGINE